MKELKTPENKVKYQPLPVMPLLALALAGFITILTEALPAGLLPQISAGLNITESLAGQMVTIYAIGSLLAAIPLTIITRSMQRRTLLLITIGGFVVANSITALSSSYMLTMVARFLAGISAGLLWAIVAGYASRMVPEHQKGKAIAIAMLGAPLALSLGMPVGAFLGKQFEWKICFALMSVIAVLLMIWIKIKMPDFAGEKTNKKLLLGKVLFSKGVRPVLLCVLTFVLAHNILYTYIAPFLAKVGMIEQTDLILFLFGLASLLGIWIVGVFIDTHLRILTLSCCILFTLVALVIGIQFQSASVIYIIVAMWGLSFGGAPTLFQTALANTVDSEVDVAQSMLVTTWNAAIASGGLMGGLLLAGYGVHAFSPVLVLLLGITLIIVWFSKRKGFPSAIKINQ